MTSTVKPEAPHDCGARLLRDLRTRLSEIMQLTETVRASLLSGEEAPIVEATKRLKTLALEYKVLAEEAQRAGLGAASIGESAELAQARREFGETATEALRASAVTGGLLERLVMMSRVLIDTISSENGAGYLPNGRVGDGDWEGLSLRERA